MKTTTVNYTSNDEPLTLTLTTEENGNSIAIVQHTETKEIIEITRAHNGIIEKIKLGSATVITKHDTHQELMRGNNEYITHVS